MLERKVISPSNANWSNIVFSNTQLVFVVIVENTAYECVLTHTSCNIMSKIPVENVIISPPKTGSQSYSFRNLSITYGKGSGPSITVHRSGTMQSQGRPEHVRLVTKSFRNCLEAVMSSPSAHRFISSLGIIRDIFVS